ncbi:VOC family protein [Aestuariivita boseongensis]|uniref:VOC family protein n=1 Tax=Aestuariivita boseongensis TaxID=1470562 RepID=UPI000680E226|nr:VOC family protein [Aestuariivita boseongensis]
MRLELDHIAVAGSTLAEATEAVEDALGVRLQKGGEHDVFFTHNTLLGLEDGLYLEGIAINPNAPTPDRPRWFDLDRFEGPARLTNWICRTDDLTGILPDLAPGVGDIVSLKRGDLRWQMAVPETGVLPFDNLHPAIIEWGTNLHPAAMLEPSGCRLTRLVIAHPRADDLRKGLAPYLRDDRVAFEAGNVPEMMAEFDTPNGSRVLR